MFGQRSTAAEWMDDAAATEPEFAGALRDLARINRLSLAYQPTLRWLDALVDRTGIASLSILDVGSGGGDMLAAIAAWAEGRGIAVSLTGLDRSPWAATYTAAAGIPARVITADLFDLPAEARFDVILCSLFTHHLSDPQLVRFLRWLDHHAARGWLISDLHRHWLPWGFVWGATRAMEMVLSWITIGYPGQDPLGLPLPLDRQPRAMISTAIIGAGPAGCAAAIALARAGHDVLLLERSPAPREVVCGEFLGVDAAAALASLGLDPVALGGIPLRRVQVAHGGRTAAAPLPFAAWGLSRLLLDGALQAAAGTALHRGITVLGAEPIPEGWRLRTSAGEIAARRLVLATGKHGLRGFPRPASPWIGLKLHLAGVEPGDAVTLLPFAGGYAGLQATQGGANLCAAVRTRPADLLAAVVAGSALGARLLRHAAPRWGKPLAVAGIPYGYRLPAGGPPGLYRIGDQASVIPSFTGEGMALALHSGLAAAAAILAGQPAEAFHAAWRRRSAGPMRWAGLGAWAMQAAPAGFAAAASFAPLARMVARQTRLA
ncbi:MAG: FAD-dependent oxidoreductase [Acetobacteraceae bacterium]|nr:MAG: FAD-dependent oxidoreductase [Acetobacteraceae bacterium]